MKPPTPDTREPSGGAVALSTAERELMEHATAWRHRQRLYRNYFATSHGTDDWPIIQALCERGLMRVVRAPTALLGGMTVFAVTETGIAALGTQGDPHAR